MKTSNDTTLEKWIEKLEKSGHVASRQRITIMTELYERQEISDLENFWMDIRQNHKVSWATFYSFIRLALKENWLKMSGSTMTHSHFQLVVE